jgi:hypothetical protein
MTINVALVVVFYLGFVKRPKGDVEHNSHNHILYKGTWTQKMTKIKKKGLMYTYLPQMHMLSSRVTSFATTF